MLVDAALVYTVRLWHQGGQWRFVVRPAGEDRLYLFTEPGQVGAFFAGLVERAGPTPPDAPAPAAGPSGSGPAP